MLASGTFIVSVNLTPSSVFTPVFPLTKADVSAASSALFIVPFEKSLRVRETSPLLSLIVPLTSNVSL